ncbi:siderophore ABC transporter substrate-binding protein [Corynebacterium striatum]|uniref:siderophore ABC transporter substrate-binding protein n=1 Tax=Corynebacterium striatum TaxID=43770 RepID=UPI00254BA427|nr:ABC transporter substrate-binding protein [Corynebacterium striatum]MDK8832233.1 ABC transporter substrate-binding protein [Corynebacterium striatum]
MTAKIRRSLVASVAALSMALAACSSAEESTSGSSDTSAASSSETTEITLEDNFGEKKIATPVTAPAVTDNRAFEILANWDVKIAAAPLKLVPSAVRDVYNKDTVAADLGSHREPDLEALVAAEPDVIWNGQRFEQYQEDIEKLVEDVPVVDFEPRDDKDFFEELKRHTKALGQTFGYEEDAAKLIKDFDAAAKRAKEAYDPSKKVMAVNTSGGEIGYIAPKIGRTYGPVFDLIGMTPALEVPEGTDDHEGDDISVEAIAESNPDWILVMDRDAAISKEGKEHVPGDKLVNENAALKNVTAVKEGNVYVAPADTYVNESIITYTEILNALADAFEKQS